MTPMQSEIIKALHVKPQIDPAEEIRNRIAFLKRYALAAHAHGFVLGISGGQDSTLAGKLTQMATEELQKETGEFYDFWALRQPYGEQRDAADAEAAIEFIKPQHKATIDIKPAVDASVALFEQASGCRMRDFIKGNLKARERAKGWYDFAGQFGLLVIGTDHAAESVTGFFTKYGDGASDILPLAGLTKRQGRQLLELLGAPARLYTKTPTADLLDNIPGRPDEDELGITYQQIDEYLEGRDVAPEVAAAIERRYHASAHKRRLPVTPFDDVF